MPNVSRLLFHFIFVFAVVGTFIQAAAPDPGRADGPADKDAPDSGVAADLERRCYLLFLEFLPEVEQAVGDLFKKSSEPTRIGIVEFLHSAVLRDPELGEDPNVYLKKWDVSLQIRKAFLYETESRAVVNALVKTNQLSKVTEKAQLLRYSVRIKPLRFSFVSADWVTLLNAAKQTKTGRLVDEFLEKYHDSADEAEVFAARCSILAKLTGAEIRLRAENGASASLSSKFFMALDAVGREPFVFDLAEKELPKLNFQIAKLKGTALIEEELHHFYYADDGLRTRIGANYRVIYADILKLLTEQNVDPNGVRAIALSEIMANMPSIFLSVWNEEQPLAPNPQLDRQTSGEPAARGYLKFGRLGESLTRSLP